MTKGDNQNPAHVSYSSTDKLDEYIRTHHAKHELLTEFFSDKVISSVRRFDDYVAAHAHEHKILTGIRKRVVQSVIKQLIDFKESHAAEHRLLADNLISTISTFNATQDKISGLIARDFDTYKASSLREFEQYKAAHVEVHRSQQIAIDKAESSLSGRLESMNELRSQIMSERSVFVTRDMLDARLHNAESLTQEMRDAIYVRIDSLAGKINELQNVKSNLDGRMAALALVWGFVVTFLSVGVTLFFKK